MTSIVAFLLGVVGGFRAMTPLALVSWCANAGLLDLQGKPLAFMSSKYAAYIFTVLAIAELINDKLPKTPSRKTPPAFVTRIVSGCLVGATIGSAAGMLVLGLICGAVGAVAGTFGGAAMRAKLASAFGRDLPAALLEDVLGIVIGLFALLRLA
jgi:Predicted membrane protein